MEIRKATGEDISRIAEILVFSKRKNYRSIFNNDAGSFVDLQATLWRNHTSIAQIC